MVGIGLRVPGCLWLLAFGQGPGGPDELPTHLDDRRIGAGQVLLGAVHEWSALVFHHGDILERESFDASIGKTTLSDPVDTVIVRLVVSRNEGARNQLKIYILAMLVGEQFLVGN